jgi:UDP-glucose 4-epimerase
VKLLITGGAGFVGSNLISRLQDKGGHQAVVFDNEISGNRQFIADLPHEFVRGDIRDEVSLRDALGGAAAVVHLAADTRVLQSIADPLFNMQVNVVGTLNLLERMRELEIKRLVNASTGGAIIGEVQPPVHEGMPPNPLSPYGASKLAVEGYCSAYAASYGIKSVSLRFSNVYGPRSFHKGSVVAHFMKQILRGEPLHIYGDGTQTRDYVHTQDISDGIIAALSGEATGPIQLGTGKPTSLNMLVELLGEVTGRVIEVVYEDFRPGEIRMTYCSIDRAAQSLGYAPKVELRDGLRETWEWFLVNQPRFIV